MARGVRIALLVVAVSLAAALAYQIVTWPDVAILAQSNPKTTAFIERYRARERRAGRGGQVAWLWVPYTAISPHLKRAVLVAEDIDFFSHSGFATAEIRSAVQRAWDERELPRGASTLTQQAAKNLWLTPSYSPLRKVKEALLTRQLERRLGKRRILEIHLNVAEFGPGVYGAEAAARRYFGVSAAALGEEQAAELAAGLPKPSQWHPGSASRVYQKRVRSIRTRMARAQWLWKVI